VAARAAGRAPYGYDMALAEGARQVVEITLLPREQQVAEGRSLPASEPRAGYHGPSTLTVALWTAGGLGVAAGAVTGISALNHKSHLDKACSPGCPPSISSELDAFRMNRTLSYVSFGVALAAAGAGTYFFLRNGSSGSQVGAMVVPGGAAVAGRF